MSKDNATRLLLTEMASLSSLAKIHESVFHLTGKSLPDLLVAQFELTDMNWYLNSDGQIMEFFGVRGGRDESQVKVGSHNVYVRVGFVAEKEERFRRVEITGMVDTHLCAVVYQLDDGQTVLRRAEVYHGSNIIGMLANPDGNLSFDQETHDLAVAHRFSIRWGVGKPANTVLLGKELILQLPTKF